MTRRCPLTTGVENQSRNNAFRLAGRVYSKRLVLFGLAVDALRWHVLLNLSVFTGEQNVEGR